MAERARFRVYGARGRTAHLRPKPSDVPSSHGTDTM